MKDETLQLPVTVAICKDCKKVIHAARPDLLKTDRGTKKNFSQYVIDGHNVTTVTKEEFLKIPFGCDC